VAEEPDTLNPFTTRAAVARRYVLGFTHETLLDVDPATGALRPALATAWEVAPDGMSFTVTLRADVQFSDGSPLGVDDVLFTDVVARTPDLVLGTFGDGLRLVRSVEVLAGAVPPRLRIALTERHFAAVRAVATSWIVVQQRFWLQAAAALAQRLGRPEPAPGADGFGALLEQLQDDPGPGTGPYRFDGPAAETPSWRRGIDLQLMRNERHWRRAAMPGCWNLGGIRIRFLTDEAARYSALVERSLDFYQGAGLDRLLARDPGLAADYRKVVYEPANLGPVVVLWNCQRPALADAAVRRALAQLFDRQGVVDKVLLGSGRPAVAYSKPGEPGYPTDLQPPAFDPAAARAALRARGLLRDGDQPLRLELLAPAGNPLFAQILDLAAAAGRRAGIDLVGRVHDFDMLMQRRQGGEWDGIVLRRDFLNWIDPYDLFHSAASGNLMGWRNAEADSLLARSRTELDPTARGQLLAQFHQLVHDEQPVSFLVQPLAEMLVNTRLQGAEPGPLGLWPERFWVARERQRRGR
jgi:peptide/nickel transport system substrate-binding protein